MKRYLRNFVTAAMCVSSVSTLAASTLSNYQATVKGQSPSFYFTFDGGSLSNQVGVSHTPVLSVSPVAVGNQLGYDVFGNPTNCVFFTLQGDYVYDPNEGSDHIISGGGVANSNSTAVGSITLLFRTPDPGPPSGLTTGPGGKCIFTAGTNAAANALNLEISNPDFTNNPPNALILSFGDCVTNILSGTNLVWDTWYYFALTYNESVTNANSSANTNKATWYLGRLSGAGTLTSGQTLNTNVTDLAGDTTHFYIGSEITQKSTFNKPGDGRVDEMATWTNRQLSAAEIQAQFAALLNPAVPPVSTYQLVVTNQGPTHYFQLAGNFADTINSSVSLATNSQYLGATTMTNAPFQNSVGFSYDYFLDTNGAAFFSAAGTDAIYTNANLLNGGGTFTGSLGSGKGSISGMIHTFPCTNYYIGQKYIFDAGGDTATSNAFSLLLESTNAPDPYSLKVRFGDSTDVLVPGSNIVSSWYYFAVTYDETVNTNQGQWWVGQPGGMLQSGGFSVLPGSLAGSGNAFFLGNSAADNAAFRYQNSSHTGNGQISQFAVWNRVLSSNEVTAQFNALSVSAAPLPLPQLFITVFGANAILSWTTNSDPTFVLQTTTNLVPAAWTNAPGVSSIIGSSYVSTNPITSKTQFYRLAR